MIVGGQAFLGDAALVAADDALVEVGDVDDVGAGYLRNRVSNGIGFGHVLGSSRHHAQCGVSLCRPSAVASMTSRGTSITSR